jgi:uncharacterized protein YjbJ (UPF0337 family)
MNEQTTNDRWTRVMGMARQHWDKLTDDDLAAVRGNSERLISALQTRYGIARAQALVELATWRQALQERRAT